MNETELSPLDKLILAVSTSETPENTTKTDEKKTLNEDEYFLAKIAANDLKVSEKPSKIKPLKDIELNTPSTSQNINKSPNTKTKISKLSVVHSGDTDSSDDESNRDFENATLNEYGKNIKHLLPEVKSRGEFQETLSKTWKPKRVAPIPPVKFGLPQVTKPQKFDENILQDPFFGMRISKPLISSAVLEERMKNRMAVSMFRVKNFIAQNGQTQDWVIAGCIVQKSIARISQNGNHYIIWTLSDLQNDLQTVSMFLFKNAYKELWKTTIGTVVGVLNPSILDNKEGSKHQATLSVDNFQRVMILGQSKDYGVCKSRKKDGDPCTAFVNTNRCSYCLYHVKQEYQKCSLRSDCQSIGGGLTALRNKVLGKNEVFYAGKSYMAIPAKKNKKMIDKDNKRLSNLMNNDFVTSIPIQKKKKSIASSLEVSRAQRLKDLQLLQKLNGSSDVLAGLESRKNCDLEDVSDQLTLEDSRQTALDVIAKLKAKTDKPTLNDPNQPNIKNNITSPPSTSKIPETNKLFPDIDTSKLKILKDLYAAPAPKLSQNAIIDLNSPIPDRAKLKALHWVQKNGPINKTNPSGVKKTGIKRFLESCESPEKKKSKLDEKAQFSERFRKIMELTSAHSDLLEQRDLDEQEKYFNKLEQQEKMEEKMMSTYKMKCKAVKCLHCKYTSFSAAPKCKEEKHALKVYDAIKRFFKCGDCGNRTVSLDVCPMFNCKKCGNTKWERATMMKEKIVNISDGLSIRGGEQKFVNSVVTDANINLLMPDD